MTSHTPTHAHALTHSSAQARAERLLADLSRGRDHTPHGGVTPTYRPAAVYDRAGTAWPGTITAWGTAADRTALCRLRVDAAARWVVYDPDRILPLVQGGT
jgi:hypothetical protein